MTKVINNNNDNNRKIYNAHIVMNHKSEARIKRVHPVHLMNVE